MVRIRLRRILKLERANGKKIYWLMKDHKTFYVY